MLQKFIFIFIITISLNLLAFTNFDKIYTADNAVAELAASELADALYDVTGKKFKIEKYASGVSPFEANIYVGIIPPNAKECEAAFKLDGNNLYFYGNDSTGNKKLDNKTLANGDLSLGSLKAVYRFLYYNTGMRWVLPHRKPVFIKQQPATAPPAPTKNRILPVTWKNFQIDRIMLKAPDTEKISSEKRKQWHRKELLWARFNGYGSPYSGNQRVAVITPKPFDDAETWAKLVKESLKQTDTVVIDITPVLSLSRLRLPFITPLKFGNCIKAAFANGACGLIGNWQGSGLLHSPMIYMANSLTGNSNLSPDEIMNEFCSIYKTDNLLIKQFYQELEEENLKLEKDLKVKNIMMHDFELVFRDQAQDIFSTAFFKSVEKPLHKVLNGNNEAKELVEYLFLDYNLSKLSSESILFINPDNTTPETMKSLLKSAKRVDSLRSNFLNNPEYCMQRMVALEKLAGDLLNQELLHKTKPSEPILCLPLAWQYKDDGSRQGVKEKWYTNEVAKNLSWKAVQTNIPLTPSEFSPAEPVNSYKADEPIGWYRCSFELPENTKNEYDLNLVLKGFAGSAIIYFNDKQLLRTDDSDKYANTAVVKVDLPKEMFAQNHKQVLTICLNSWNYNFPGGIWQPAWLFGKKIKK